MTIVDSADNTARGVIGRSRLRRSNAAARLVVDAWRRSSATRRAVAVVAVIAAVGAGRHPTIPWAAALTVAALVPAALVDAVHRRLPDVLVRSAAVVFVVTTIATASTEDSTRAGAVALGAAVVAGPLLLLHLASPAAMGFGDVKTGVVLGAALGSVDWPAGLAALAIATAATATVGIVTRRRTLPLGPGLIAGAAVVLVCWPLVAPPPGPADPIHGPRSPTGDRGVRAEANVEVDR